MAFLVPLRSFCDTLFVAKNKRLGREEWKVADCVNLQSVLTNTIKSKKWVGDLSLIDSN